MAFEDVFNVLLISTVIFGILIAVCFRRYFKKVSHEAGSSAKTSWAEKLKEVQMEEDANSKKQNVQINSDANVIVQNVSMITCPKDGRSKKEKRIAERRDKSGYQQGDSKPNSAIHRPSTPEVSSVIDIMGGKKTFIGQGNLHGYNFQTKVLCLYFCLGHGFQNFRLATEVPEMAVGKFDDMVLCYDEGKTKTKYSLLQAKEEIKQDFPKITPQELKSATDKRFSLPVYFNSYVKLRDQFLKLIDGKMHCIEHLIMYTNAEFDLPKFHVLEHIDNTYDAAKDKIVIRKLGKDRSPFIPDNAYQFVQFPTEVLRLFYKKNEKEMESVFQEFIEKLVFAVGQPDYSKLDGTIVNALSDAFNLNTAVSMSNEIVGQIWNIYSQPVGQVINDEINKFFEESRKRINERFLLEVMFTNHLQSINFTNFFKATKDIAEFLLKNMSQCIFIRTNVVTLSAVKVAQALQHNCAKFKFPEQYFTVVDLPFLLNSWMRTKLTLECRKEFTIVVKLESCKSTHQDVYNVLSELLRIVLNLGPQKTIILVENENCDFSRMDLFANICFTDFLDQCSLEDFTEETKAMLMTRAVNLQGREAGLNLSDIISESNVKTLKTNMILLDKIVENEILCIGRNVKSISSLGDFYIQRQFAWNLKYNKECLSRIPDSELLVLCNTKLETVDQYLIDKDKFNFEDQGVQCFCYGNVIVIENRINDENFANICSRFSSKNVHWLDGINNTFIAVKSKQMHYQNSEELIRNDGKVLIITGDPGIGKSFSLPHILQQIRLTTRGVLWIIQVNLVGWIDDLEALSKKPCLFLEDAVNLLCKVEDLRHEYEKELLTYHIVNAGNSHIFFDGFDEICPSYEDVVIKILKILNDTRAIIWITTRPHFQVKLEKELCCFSYRLVQFSESDQKLFLFKYWTKEIKHNSNESFISLFVDKIFDILMHSRIKMVSHLIGIPLQAKMFAELYEDECDRFLNQPDQDIAIQEIIDVLDLYEKFVEKKNEIYFREKALLEHNTPLIVKVKKESSRKFSDEHNYFAIKLLFPKDFETLVAAEVIRKVDDASELMKVGLILKETNHYVFTHQTYAEYFAARCLADVVQADNKNGSKKHSHVLEFLKEQYLKESNTMMVIFFDHMLAKGSDRPILKAAVNDDLHKMENILKDDPGCLSHSDCLKRNALHLAAAYATYHKVPIGENITTTIALLHNQKSWLRMHVDKCDLLNFNVLCFALGKNSNVSFDLLSKVRKFVSEQCLVDMTVVLLCVLYQLEEKDPFVHSGVKYLLFNKLSTFLQHKNCLTFLKLNMHHTKRMKAFLHLVISEKPLHIFTENNFAFLKHTLTCDGFFSDLLLDCNVELSFLEVQQEAIVNLGEFQNWFFNVVKTFQFNVLNKLLISGIVSETCGKELWHLPGLNFLELFRSAVDLLENKLVLHIILSLNEIIEDLFASIDYEEYFRTVFLNKMYRDFENLFDTIPEDEMKARILNNFDHVVLFKDAMAKKDSLTLDNLLRYFNSDSQILAMKASVRNQLVIDYAKGCILLCTEYALNPLLKCISVRELTRVWDVLGCEGDLNNFGYNHPGYTVVQGLRHIPDRQELTLFLDNFPSENPRLEWSVWEHVYSLFFSLEMSLPLPPNIEKVFGNNYIQQVLDSKVDFQNVDYIFHLATDDQRRAICRAEKHAFFKHAVCNYFTEITDVKCGDGKYLEGMQDEIVALQEYGTCFRNAVDRRDFNVLLVLTRYLSTDMQVNMWVAVDYQSVFLASIELLENTFSFHLNEVFSISSGQDLIKAVDFSKTFIQFPILDLRCFNDLFSKLNSDQRRDLIAQTNMFEEFANAVREMDFEKLNALYDSYEGCQDVTYYIKEHLNTDMCTQYFKYHLRNRNAEGIRALLQYITGAEMIYVKRYSLYCFKMLEKGEMEDVFKFIDDLYLQQILTSLDEFPPGYHLSIWQHVIVLTGCRWNRERIPDYFTKYFRIDNPYLKN